MKQTIPCVAALAAALAVGSSTHASIIGLSLQNISSQFAANPMYQPSMSTWLISIQFNNPADSITGTTAWNVSTTFGYSFFNANPVTHDPVSLINDANGGNVPNPSVAGLTGAFPVYFNWAFDSFLMLNSPTAVGTTQEVIVGLNSGNSTHVGPGGLFTSGPFPTAGADLQIPVAQFTIVGQGGPGVFAGLFTALQGSSSQTLTFSLGPAPLPPAPGGLAAFLAAGLLGRSRRRA